MTAIDSVLPRLKTEEGFRMRVYRDTEGHQTIGYGFNVDAGLTQRVASALLQAQLRSYRTSSAPSSGTRTSTQCGRACVWISRSMTGFTGF